MRWMYLGFVGVILVSIGCEQGSGTSGDPAEGPVRSATPSPDPAAPKAAPSVPGTGPVNSTPAPAGGAAVAR